MRKDGYQMKNEGTPGQVIWACAYELNSKGTGKLGYSKPIQGMLMLGDTESSHDWNEKHGYKTPRYFVPFKKNNKDLAWSKAVSIYSRRYADSKEECLEYFKDIINEEIKIHKERIRVLEEELKDLEENLK